MNITIIALPSAKKLMSKTLKGYEVENVLSNELSHNLSSVLPILIINRKQ